MSELQVTATCKIHPGKLDEFRQAAKACLAAVQERDSGTHQYDWFFNADQTVCVVRERYRDSAAVLEHLSNLQEELGALTAVSHLSVEVFGEPSQELIDATTAIPTQIYSFYQGL